MEKGSLKLRFLHDLVDFMEKLFAMCSTLAQGCNNFADERKYERFSESF